MSISGLEPIRQNSSSVHRSVKAGRRPPRRGLALRDREVIGATLADQARQGLMGAAGLGERPRDAGGPNERSRRPPKTIPAPIWRTSSQHQERTVYNGNKTISSPTRAPRKGHQHLAWLRLVLAWLRPEKHDGTTPVRPDLTPGPRRNRRSRSLDEPDLLRVRGRAVSSVREMASRRELTNPAAGGGELDRTSQRGLASGTGESTGAAVVRLGAVERQFRR